MRCWGTRPWQILAAVILSLDILPARGHGDLHLQIQEVTEEISKSPTDAVLYLKRGELNRIHQLYDAAMADFEQVRTLAPTNTPVSISLGRLYVEMQLPLAARAALDRYLVAEPSSSEAYTLRGRAWIQLEDPMQAARDFKRAIDHNVAPGPELFIEHSRALAMAGPTQQESALAALDRGIQSLGPLVTLQLPAIDLEVDMKRYDAALARLDQLAARSPRKETWLKRRGEILRQAGRPADAQAAFRQALESLNTLPPSRRNVPAMVALEKELKQLLIGEKAVDP